MKFVITNHNYKDFKRYRGTHTSFRFNAFFGYKYDYTSQVNYYRHIHSKKTDKP
jgi:hypothetical protein